ncbi:MAG: hypothetical protein DBY32_03975 [Phascolarctobacterium sp.]|nr:MAG: hypothetical protein DBY32_03975 [Phascolarctobacterium sp.]
MANYMQQVAQMLGVKMEEPFRIKMFNGRSTPPLYKLTEHGLMFKEADDDDWEESTFLGGLLTGTYEIALPPWKPKNGDMYYYVVDDNSVWGIGWTGSLIDLVFFSAGNCYHTKQEAEEATESGELMAKLKKYYDEYEKRNEG